MGILKRLRNGKPQYGVSRRLPRNKLGMKHFRRWYPNRTIANKVLGILNGAIAIGEIDSVLPGLVGAGGGDYTVATFYERFEAEYCKPRLTSWKRYRQSFRRMLPGLGTKPLRDFTRGHLHTYLESRVKQVSASTANKDIAAMKKMFSYALEVGAVAVNPLIRFPLLRVQEKALRMPTLEEYRKFVDAMPNAALSALAAVWGESAIRKTEGLNLKWNDIDWRGRRIVVEKTKGKRVRSIPLTDYAIEKLRQVIRFVGQEHVFCYQIGQRAGKRICRPYKAIARAAEEAGLDWIKPHMLRDLRATSWLHHGADIRTVQEALGHVSITTTQRYTKHIETYSDRAIREAQEREKEEIGSESDREKNVRRED